MSQYYYNPFGSGSDMNNNAMQMNFLRQQQAKKEKHEIRVISFSMGCAIVAYLIIQTIAVQFLNMLGWNDFYSQSTTFQYAFNILFVSFLSVLVPFGIVAIVNKKRYERSIVPSEKVGFAKGFCWVCFGMAGCVLANVVVSYIVAIIQQIVGHDLYSGLDIKPDSIFAIALEFVGIAIIPAICEELAMRAFSLQLLAKYGKGFGVFAVSLVFGLLHGNIVQFIFAFLVGVILGFVTVKTNNIAPAIFIHAFNNGMSAVQSAVTYFAGENTANIVSVIVYVFWIAAGVLSGLYLLLKKEFVKTKEKSNSVLTTGQKFSAFLFPWMIVPFVELIVITAINFTIKA